MRPCEGEALILSPVVRKHTYLSPRGGNVQLSGVSEVAPAQRGLPRGCGAGPWHSDAVVWQLLSRSRASRQGCSHRGPIRKLITGCQRVGPLRKTDILSTAPPPTHRALQRGWLRQEVAEKWNHQETPGYFPDTTGICTLVIGWTSLPPLPPLHLRSQNLERAHLCNFLGKMRTQKNYSKEKLPSATLSPLCLGPWYLQYQSSHSKPHSRCGRSTQLCPSCVLNPLITPHIQGCRFSGLQFPTHLNTETLQVKRQQADLQAAESLHWDPTGRSKKGCGGERMFQNLVQNLTLSNLTWQLS